MKTVSLATPEAAQQAFYRALENADLEAMMAVWEDGAESVCIHPLGPRLQGTAQIRESWRQIFNSGVRLRFRLTSVHGLLQDDCAVYAVYENITVLGADEQPAQPVIATNIFWRGASGWRLLLHHASPGPAIRSGLQPPPDGRVH